MIKTIYNLFNFYPKNLVVTDFECKPSLYLSMKDGNTGLAGLGVAQAPMIFMKSLSDDPCRDAT